MTVEKNHLQAMQLKKPKYLSVNSCPVHGTVERYTKNRGCVSCIRERSKQRYILSRGSKKRIDLTIYEQHESLIREFVRQLNDSMKGT